MTRAARAIAARDLGALVRSPAGWIVAALAMLADGLGFSGIALGRGLRPSSLVLEDAIAITAVTTAITALLLASRGIADERQGGRLVLYLAAPVAEREIALGKCAAAAAFALACHVGLVAQLATIAWRGALPPGHALAGAVGVVLVAMSASALGTLASSLAPTPGTATVAAAAMLGTLALAGPLAQVVGEPFRGVVGWLAYHHAHVAPFARGEIAAADVVFHLGLGYVALTGSAVALARERRP